MKPSVDIQAFPSYNSSAFLMKASRIVSDTALSQCARPSRSLSNNDVVYLFEPKDALHTAQIMERHELQRLVIMN